MTEAAPFFADLAEGPEGGRAVWLRTADGVRIRAGIWAGGHRGTVVLLPGRTEYIEKYGQAAADLQRRGWSTVSIDWRGQGLADHALPDRRYGHVEDFDEYQRDLDAVLAQVAAEGLPQPLVMLGHSMGGCIGLRALHRGLGIRAVAFSAPMWGIALPVWERPVARLLTAVAGPLHLTRKLAPDRGPETYVTTARFEGNLLTGDRAMWNYMRHHVEAQPDFALGGPTLGWARAALAECGALMRLPPPDVPALTVVGTEERIVTVGPIRRHMAQWQGAKLEVYAGARHEVLMEGPAVRQRFFDSACALFETQRSVAAA